MEHLRQRVRQSNQARTRDESSHPINLILQLLLDAIPSLWLLVLRQHKHTHAPRSTTCSSHKIKRRSPTHTIHKDTSEHKSQQETQRCRKTQARESDISRLAILDSSRNDGHGCRYSNSITNALQPAKRDQLCAIPRNTTASSTNSQQSTASQDHGSSAQDIRNTPRQHKTSPSSKIENRRRPEQKRSFHMQGSSYRRQPHHYNPIAKGREQLYANELSDYDDSSSS
jgi:hypothetical protein